MHEALKFYVPIALLVIAGFAAALIFAQPAPPDRIRMATGPADGGYAAFGARYRDALAAEGVEVELIETRGAVENIALLNDPRERVDVAFVQGGSPVETKDYPDLESLGSMYREPIWIFVRADRRPKRISELAGLRVAVGEPGSGTRIVATEMLAVNGLGPGSVEMVALGDAKSVEALLAGDVDAAFFVTGAKLDRLRRLASTPGIQLMNLERAEAYAVLYDGFSVVKVPRGVIDLAADQPSEDLALVSAVASLVGHKDLHPAIAQLLIETAQKIHGRHGRFADTGEFPSPNYVEFPLNDVAQHHYEHGPGLLRRYLPYWAANLVGRLWVLILPAIALLVPVMRMAPPAFKWQVRRRIYKWYRHLNRIELAEQAEKDPARRQALLHKLEALHTDVLRVRVPLSYAAELYALRLHIKFVRGQLTEAGLDEPLGDADAGERRSQSSSI